MTDIAYFVAVAGRIVHCIRFFQEGIVVLRSLCIVSQSQIPLLQQAMSSKKRSRGSAAAKGPCVSSVAPVKAKWKSTALASPERPDDTRQSEPLCLSSIVPAANASTTKFITKEELASALAGLEGKISGMIIFVTHIEQD